MTQEVIQHAFDRAKDALKATGLSDVECEKLDDCLQITSHGVTLFIIPKRERRFKDMICWYLENEGGNGEGVYHKFLSALEICLLRCYETSLRQKFYGYNGDWGTPT